MAADGSFWTRLSGPRGQPTAALSLGRRLGPRARAGVLQKGTGRVRCQPSPPPGSVSFPIGRVAFPMKRQRGREPGGGGWPEAPAGPFPHARPRRGRARCQWPPLPDRRLFEGGSAGPPALALWVLASPTLSLAGRRPDSPPRLASRPCCTCPVPPSPSTRVNSHRRMIRHRSPCPRGTVS